MWHNVAMKDDVIRFRCDKELKARFEAVAKLERRDPADLARIIFEDYVNGKAAAIQDAPSAAPPPPAQPVSYKGKTSSKTRLPASEAAVVEIVKAYSGKSHKAVK
jgi:hypothetical protein